jgi:protein-tyrosine phosphatase
MALIDPPANVQHYPVETGLFAGEYPGGVRRENALARIRQLVNEGVTTFIDLTTPEDAALGLAPYEHLLSDCSPELVHHRFAIPDMGIPAGPETMRAVLDLIRREKAAGKVCYVHCWGGIGRTGTAVACWLVERGMAPDAALARVQQLYESHMSLEKRERYPHSPQQPAQLAYVRNWAANT